MDNLCENKQSVLGITTYLTNKEIDTLHKGHFVHSGDYEKLSKLSNQDPIFYSVCGKQDDTLICNSIGCVPLPDIRIKLGSKFDLRF